jgi:hypothetical protein
MATDFKFKKVKNEPLNRDGETLDDANVDKADLVGLANDGSGNTVIKQADAAAGVQQPAMGVLMERVRDPSNITASGFNDSDVMVRQLQADLREGDYTFVGDQATYIRYGIYLEDVNEEDSLTIGDPVYLAVGGGFTQTAPSSTDEIVQVLGVATDQNTVLLDVAAEYEVVA